MVWVLATNPTTASICFGDSIHVANHYHKTTGVYYDTLLTSAMHDSLIITTLTVNALPTLTVTANHDTICAGDMVTLSVSGTATTYTWSTSATTSTVSVSPVSTTIYTVTGTNVNVCKNKATQTVVVNNCVGIEQITGGNEQVLVYPNPASNSFQVEFSGSGEKQMQVFDVNGKLVLSKIIQNGKATIDASILTNGVYNIALISKEGITNKHLVITK